MIQRGRGAIVVAVAVTIIVVIGGGVLATRLAAPAGLGPVLGVPRFVDETAAAGVATQYDGDSSYATGGGVATFDCSSDGRPDLFVAGGAGPSAIQRTIGPIGGALRFAPAVDPPDALGSGALGAYPLDIDGDRLVDLAILRVDGVRLLRGLGDCRFEDGAAAWSFDVGSGWSTAFSAAWEGDGQLPTLAVGRYLRIGPTGQAIADCDDNALVRPAPGRAAYGPAVPLTPGFCTLSMLFSDWDRSGRRDLRITNDRQYYIDGGEQLWRIQPGEQARLYTDADGWRRLEIWGMGIASRDVTGDGYPEVYLTSQGDNKLQTLTGGPAQPAFRDIALRRGVAAAQPFIGGDPLPSTAWHPAFEDVNNDGRVDLFVSKGNVNVMAEYAANDPSNLLLGQDDGIFSEAADEAGIVTFARGRGAAIVDFNLDGLLDIVQLNYGQPVVVWRNVGSGDASKTVGLGGWVALRLSQAGPNRDAVGAWLEVRVGDRVSEREVTVGGGHLGGGLGWIHSGLGAADRADVRVRWPDGELGPWLAVEAGRFFDLERGAGAAIHWTPSAP